MWARRALQRSAYAGSQDAVVPKEDAHQSEYILASLAKCASAKADEGNAGGSLHRSWKAWRD